MATRSLSRLLTFLWVCHMYTSSCLCQSLRLQASKVTRRNYIRFSPILYGQVIYIRTIHMFLVRHLACGLLSGFLCDSGRLPIWLLCESDIHRFILAEELLRLDARLPWVFLILVSSLHLFLECVLNARVSNKPWRMRRLSHCTKTISDVDETLFKLNNLHHSQAYSDSLLCAGEHVSNAIMSGCQICKRKDAVIPVIAHPCSHLFCYFCLRSQTEHEPGYRCPICDEVITSMKRCTAVA